MTSGSETHWPWEHKKIDGIWHRRPRLKRNTAWQRLEVIRVSLPLATWKKNRNSETPDYVNKWVWKSQPKR